MAAPFMSGEDDAGGAIDLTTFGIINLDDVRRSEEFTADAAGIAVDDIAAVASDLERCAHGEEVRDKIIGIALHHASAEAGIGSASGRERGCQYVESSGVAVSLKKKRTT